MNATEEWIATVAAGRAECVLCHRKIPADAEKDVGWEFMSASALTTPWHSRCARPSGEPEKAKLRGLEALPVSRVW
jgi:hypothetical protein